MKSIESIDKTAKSIVSSDSIDYTTGSTAHIKRRVRLLRLLTYDLVPDVVIFAVIWSLLFVTYRENLL